MNKSSRNAADGQQDDGCILASPEIIEGVVGIIVEGDSAVAVSVVLKSSTSSLGSSLMSAVSSLFNFLLTQS